MTDSFKARKTLSVGAQQYEILSLSALRDRKVDRLPYSLKTLAGFIRVLATQPTSRQTPICGPRCCSTFFVTSGLPYIEVMP